MQIIWRPVPNLSPGVAQNGTAEVIIGEQPVVVRLEIRPGRRHGRMKPALSLSLNGQALAFRPTVQACKSKAEQAVKDYKLQITKLQQ